jgi:hypothetical protein
MIVAGMATVRPEFGGVELRGAVVDVSATGARLRVTPGLDLPPGSVVDVEFAIADLKGPPGALPVRLTGHGVVLRFVEIPAGGSEAALRFEEPLRVCESFPTSASRHLRPA